MKGKFIVIDGSDGLGKTTLIEGLKKEYKDKYIFLNDPSMDLPLSKKIRRIRQESCNNINPTIDLLLTLAARKELTDYIKSKLENGNNVICDRYILSTYAYQGKYFKMYMIMYLHYKLNLEVRPDLTILLTREKPYREEINDSIEKVYSFEETNSNYKKLYENEYMNNIYGIKKIELKEKTREEILEEAKELIKSIG